MTPVAESEHPRVLLVGATGALGGRIARELRRLRAPVRALVRPGTREERVRPLREQGVEIVEADLGDHGAVVRACGNVSCVVSALLGLREVLVEAQGKLLDAAVEAGVPRFVPSDYAMDFTKIEPGSNRNFDLHREFREKLLRSPIRATAVLNGAFMNLLTGEAPLVLFKIHRVLYWGKEPDQRMDFTTMDDTAAFTANVALDAVAPPILRISGEQISAAGLATIASDVSGRSFRLLRGGSLSTLRRIIQVTRTLTPASDAPFPVWQGMQYLHGMFEGRGLLTPLDNDRYPGMTFTGVRTVLQEFVARQPA